MSDVSLDQYPGQLEVARNAVDTLAQHLASLQTSLRLLVVTDATLKELKASFKGGTKEERAAAFEEALLTDERGEEYRRRLDTMQAVEVDLSQAKNHVKRLEEEFSAARNLCKERVARLDRENLTVELEIIKHRLEAAKLTAQVLAEEKIRPRVISL